MRSLLTSVASAAVLAATSLALAGPVRAAERGVVYDGDDPGAGFTPLQALALFAGIPALAVLLIALAVFGPAWARGRNSDAVPGAQGEPVWLTSPAGSMSAPHGPGMITPGGPTDHEERGGASARW